MDKTLKVLAYYKEKYPKYFEKDYSKSSELLKDFVEDKNELNDFHLLENLMLWEKEKKFYEVTEAIEVDKSLNIEELYKNIKYMADKTYLKQKFYFYKNNSYEESLADGVFIRTDNVNIETGNNFMQFLFNRDSEMLVFTEVEIKKNLTIAEYLEDINSYNEDLTIEDIEDIQIAVVEALTSLNKIFN